MKTIPFAGAVACVAIFFGAVIVAAFTNTFDQMVGLLKTANAVRLIAIVAVMIPTTILALARTIPSKAVVAILSGVAGWRVVNSEMSVNGVAR